MTGTEALVKQAGLTDSSATTPVAILDAGAGSGVISRVLYNNAQIRGRITELTAVDVSPAMVEVYNKRAKQEQWTVAQAHVASLLDTKLAADHFDAVLAGWVIFMLPAPEKGIQGELSLTNNVYLQSYCRTMYRVQAIAQERRHLCLFYMGQSS